MSSVNDIQDEIIEEFSILEGDLDMCVEYIIELGKKIHPLPEELRIDDNIVKGCQSKVWLAASYHGGHVNFITDSNTMITKGLAGMLVRVFSVQTPTDILQSELYFIQKIGMSRFIGTQRWNGFAAMIKQIKLYDLAFSIKDGRRKESDE